MCWFPDTPSDFFSWGCQWLRGVIFENQQGKYKPHGFSLCTCSVGLQRGSVSRRHAKSSEQDVATIHLPTMSAVPTRLQIGCPPLAPPCCCMFPVSCSEIYDLHLSSTAFWQPLWTKGGRETWQEHALGRGGERRAWVVSLLVLLCWRLPRVEWGLQRQPILQSTPSRGCGHCPCPMPCQA